MNLTGSTVSSYIKSVEINLNLMDASIRSLKSKYECSELEQKKLKGIDLIKRGKNKKVKSGE
jgi:hypothetical protein